MLRQSVVSIERTEAFIAIGELPVAGMAEGEV